MIQKSYDGKSILYLIPTPIGNLEDITFRAIKILKEVDFVLCEDTRVTSILLKKYGIKKNLFRCDEFSQKKVESKVLLALSEGKNIGLVSDAGSPLVSDPGYIISKTVIENGFNVVALPGPTAFVPALSMSGISSSSFLFYGFLDKKNGKKKKELEKLKFIDHTLIFYESPHNLISTLELFNEVFGDRNISIAREISKIYEEVIRGKLSDVLNSISSSSVRGEYVIIVDGNRNKSDFSDLSIVEHVNLYLSDGMKKMDAIKMVAKERNVSKSIIYKEYNNSGK